MKQEKDNNEVPRDGSAGGTPKPTRSDQPGIPVVSDDDGASATDGTFTLRVVGFTPVFQRHTVAAVDGLAVGQVAAICIVPKVDGNYDDANLTVLAGATQDDASLPQQQRLVFLPRGGQIGLNRLSLFVWSAGVSVDFDDLDFSTAHRLDLDDLLTIDLGYARGGGNRSVHVSDAVIDLGKPFNTTVTGTPSEAYELAAQWYADPGYAAEIVLASGVIPSSGIRVSSLLLSRPADGDWNRQILVSAKFVDETVSLVVVPRSRTSRGYRRTTD